MNMKIYRFFIAFLVLVLVSLACGKGAKTSEPTSPPPPPPAPTAIKVSPTAVPTDTAVPPTPTPEEPTAIPKPELEVEPGWYQFTNGNYVRGIALLDRTIWAATGGGIVSLDLASGQPLQKYTTLDGLPTNDIQAVVACPIPEARVIFGTEAGLSIYDPAAQTWEHLTPDTSSMKYVDVNSLDCDAENHTLLVGYTWGLDIFYADKNEWKFYDEEAGLATDWVSHAAVIGTDIWVVSSFGVSTIHADGTISGYTETLGNIPDENVQSVAGDARGNVWLAAFDGLLKFSNGQFTLYNSDNTEKFPFLEAFYSVRVALDGSIWAGNAFGSICQFDAAKEECSTIYEDLDGMVGGLDQMILDESGNPFYCDDGEGISYFDGSGWTALVLDEIAGSNRSYAIAESTDGTMWVGSDAGLQQFSAYTKDPAWDTVDIDGQFAYAFFQVPGGMWVGHSGGASFYNYETQQWTLLETGDPGKALSGYVSALTMDGKGRMWFGTSSGLTVWDGKTYTYYDLLTEQEKTDGWSAKFIYAVIYDGVNVWLGTSGALFRFDKEDQMTRWDDEFESLLSIFSPSTFAFALDQDGKVLMAIDDKLVRFENGKFTDVYQADSYIYSIFTTNAGEIWLGLYSTGAAYFDGSQWTKYSTGDGLPSPHFDRYSILVDSAGTTWFAGSEGGLARYVP